MRKVFITLLIIVTVVATGASIWALLKKPDEPYFNTTFDAIPLNAALIVDIRDYGDFCNMLRNNNLWNNLCEIASINTFNEELQLIDSLLLSYEQTAPFRNNMIFSFHPVGKDEMQSIGYVSLNSEKEVQNLVELLRIQLTGKANITQLNYDNVIITDIVFTDRKQQSFNFSFAYRNGIFIFSRSTILLQYAIRQIKADSKITDQGKLAELKRSSGKNASANIYINYDGLPRVALNFFQTRHRKNIESLVRFADWTELDLNLKQDNLLLNGFTECSDVSDHWFETLLAQPPMQVALVDAMPSSTYAYLWMGLRKLEQYFSDYSLYLERNKQTERKKELDRLRTSQGIDLKKDLNLCSILYKE